MELIRSDNLNIQSNLSSEHFYEFFLMAERIPTLNNHLNINTFKKGIGARF